jgi:hypothetical protein
MPITINATRLWKRHSFDYHEPNSSDPVRVMVKGDFIKAVTLLTKQISKDLSDPESNVTFEVK